MVVCKGCKILGDAGPPLLEIVGMAEPLAEYDLCRSNHPKHFGGCRSPVPFGWDVTDPLERRELFAVADRVALLFT